jgi:hypothetical protein
MMPRKVPKRAAEVKREIQVIDRELYHLRELQRRYSKRMLRGGIMIWICGILAFAAAGVIQVGVDSLLKNWGVWAPLLIIALSAPLVISALFIRRLELKEKRMELIRKNLMEKFEQAMLKRVEKLVRKT